MHISGSLVFFSIVCLLDLPVNAAPTCRGGHRPSRCNVSTERLPLPMEQVTLTIPNDTRPVFITAGFGTQNYTCSSAGTYTSIGAVAELFDVSCVFDTLTFNNTISAYSNDTQSSMHAFHGPKLLLGHHYFVSNPTPNATGLSPVFDFRADSQKGMPDAFVITSKIGDIPSPINSTLNVDWLELQAIEKQGMLAKYVFRIFTIGGQPPSSCTPGSDSIAVPYAANYWFFA